jgi:ABC-2 type transport system permease protein
MIESIITANIDDFVPELVLYFPMKSIWNLIAFPLPRYAFQEIQDYVALSSIITVVAWTIFFNYMSYLKLKRSDI